MSKEQQELSDELIKALSEGLDMTPEELTDLLKSEDEDLEKGDKMDEEEEEETEKKDNAEEEKKEDTKKSEIEDLQKSIADSLNKLKELKGIVVEEKVEKSEDDNLMKALEDSNNKLEKAISDMQESFNTTLEGVQSKIEEISKSVELIGESSQGTKGIRYSSFLSKAGDTAPIQKGDKTYLDSRDREGISNAMLDAFEKSEDDDFKNKMKADLINYQGSGVLEPRAIINLSKAGYMFKEQLEGQE